jgi:COMPASS component SWD3
MSQTVYSPKLILTGHTLSVSALKFSPDGSMLASACLSPSSFIHPSLNLPISAADKLIKIWNSQSGAVLHTFPGHTEGINDVDWSPDGAFLASPSDDKSVRIWSLQTVNLSPFSHPPSHLPCLQRSTVRILNGHTNFVFCVHFHPRSTLLVSGGYDETVRIWDIAGGTFHLFSFSFLISYHHHHRQGHARAPRTLRSRHSGQF